MKIIAMYLHLSLVGVPGVKPSNSREGGVRALEMPLSANEKPHLYRYSFTPTTAQLVGIRQVSGFYNACQRR